jgi:hypothetical protein
VELEYRLAGLYLKKGNLLKGKFHLQNSLKRNSEYIIIMEELFPVEYKMQEVQQLLNL